MRKLSAALFLLSGNLWAAGTTANLTVSSGTFQPVSMYSNSDGGNRQAIVIGDYSSSSTARADWIQGLTVNLATSALTTTDGMKVVPGATNLVITSTATLPISAASLPLPTGASTAAKQPALGTAGSASADVISVQGVASMTALKVDGSGVTQPVSGTVTASQATAASLKASVLIDGTSNTVQISGTPSVTVSGYPPVMIISTNTLTTSASQSGTWTVQPGNTANTTAWKVDGSAVTQPISGTVTASQTTAASLKASVLIDGTSNTVQITGTPASNITQIGGTSIVTGGVNGLIAVGGPVASGTANADNPVKFAVVATSNTPTFVNEGASGAIADIRGTRSGAVVTVLDCPREQIVKSSITITTSTSETVILSSGAASVFNDLLELVTINTSATAARVDFRSGGGPTGQTIDFALYVPSGETRGFATPHPWPQTLAAANWTAQASASVTDIRIYGIFCKSK